MKGDRIYSKALKAALAERPDLEYCSRLLTRAVKLGNHKAMYALATWHLHGKFYPKDPNRAVELLDQSSQRGNSDAMYDLAVCYEKGIGVKKNADRAFELYVEAQLNGDLQSIYEVGRCYYYGIGIPQNRRIANIWLRRAEQLDID